MKKTILAGMICLCSFISFSQIKEGKIVYLAQFTSNDPDAAEAIVAMGDSHLNVAFAPGKSRTDYIMGPLMTTITIADMKAGKILVLADAMGMKTAVESEVKKSTGTEQDFKVEETKETKSVLGYNCTKAVLTAGDGSEVIMWFTKEIAADIEGQFYNEIADGFPLEYELEMNGMFLKMTAVSFEKTVGMKLFDMTIPEGYTLMTEEELMGQ